MKKKIWLTVTALVLVCVVLILIVTIPSTKNGSSIENKFLNEKSDYQGVITLWNIDTFESGTASKKSFLEKIAIEFEKENRGLYLLVKNMTVDECLLQLEEGNKPNLFSFGEGLFDILEPYFSGGLENINVKSIIKNNNKNLSIAAPWCFGFYALITTASNLEKSGNTGNSNLRSIIDSCGYEKKLKKSTKQIDSYVYGGADYTNIKIMLGNISSSVKENTNTFFEAYEKFINGNATILCGTQRDIARMDNKVGIGKIDGYIYDCIYDYTDLVQYIAYSDCNNKKANLYAKKFISYLLSDDVQKRVGQIGMCATKTGIVSNTEGTLGQIETKFI